MRNIKNVQGTLLCKVGNSCFTYTLSMCVLVRVVNGRTCELGGNEKEDEKAQIGHKFDLRVKVFP